MKSWLNVLEQLKTRLMEIMANRAIEQLPVKNCIGDNLNIGVGNGELCKLAISKKVENIWHR
jgi:hypothetical protein